MTIMFTDDHRVLPETDDAERRIVRCDLCRLATETAIPFEHAEQVTILCDPCFHDSFSWS